MELVTAQTRQCRVSMWVVRQVSGWLKKMNNEMERLTEGVVKIYILLARRSIRKVWKTSE